VTFSLPQALVLAALEVGGWVVTSALLERRRLSDRALRVVVSLPGLAIALALALAYNPLNFSELSMIYIVPFSTTFFLVLGVWMLGGFHATEIVSYERVYDEFRLGLIAIVTTVLMATLFIRSDINTLWASLGGVVLLFFGAGLAGLALSNREVVRHETGDAGLRSWGVFLVSSVGAILLLGVLAQGIGQGNIIGAFQGVAVGAALVLGGLIFGFIALVLWPLSLFNIHLDPSAAPPAQQTPVTQAPPLDPFAQLRAEFGDITPSDMPLEWKIILITLVSIVVVALVVFLMSRWLRNTQRNKDVVQGEEHEQFGSWSLFLAQLKALFGRLLARFRRIAPATAHEDEDDLASLVGKPEWEGTLTVRQIYIGLLRFARSAGYPRSPQQTSVEYLKVLSGALPDLTSELQTITAAYLEARYSHRSPSPVTVHAANEAWRAMTRET
jgi:hypothetical protein